MTSKCLVTYGDKNVVNFDEPWTGRQLIANLKEREMFAEVDISTLGLTCFDEDFQVHVDISEEDAIENKSKIKVKETCQVRIADVLQESPQPTQPARGSVYCLPAVPPDIAMAVQRHQAGQHFAGRQRVLQWLHHDLYLYDMYPGRLYTEAARALVIRFPNLADATGTGYATAMVEAEDGETVACHISAMANEILKARPDMAYIEDCMARTLASRREWVAKENPSVDEMLLKYPVLSISSIVFLPCTGMRSTHVQYQKPPKRTVIMGTVLVTPACTRATCLSCTTSLTASCLRHRDPSHTPTKWLDLPPGCPLATLRWLLNAEESHAAVPPQHRMLRQAHRLPQLRHLERPSVTEHGHIDYSTSKDIL
ncbi:hypothetical protein HPB49_009993 [Dermacentor silvarum]|uniref:Uncharacterized protein n=1 Tax=Dermacentor silvarum TaxID=543639 RepID=A0ACB8DYJ0_DERSI|nr:hypothetical protein HPB49_009993 [Dermacentor silvarum]